MKKKKVLILIAFCGAFINCVTATPVQWRTEDGGNGHYYDVILVGTPLSWDEARTSAQAIGTDWDLVTITSLSESNFVKNLFGNDSSYFNIAGSIGTNASGPWIGGFDVVSSNHFQWVTGEAITYTEWGPLEPFGNGQTISYTDFASPYADGIGIGWNDIGPNVRPDGPIAYIAETVPEPATLSLLGLGGLLLRRRKS